MKNLHSSFASSRRLTLVLALLLASIPLVGSGCPADPVEDPCAGRLIANNLEVTVAEGGSFNLSSPPAKNTCHAVYMLQWRWANPEKSRTNATMPPLGNLKYAFAPEDGGYFEHTEPKGVVEGGLNLWSITADQANKNSTSPHTVHTVNVTVPRKTEDPLADSVIISATILYKEKL
jgi:hypothetical protein